MSTHAIEINSPADLAKVLQEHNNVLVDFWAAWCGPCRKVGPVLDQLAEESQGNLTIAKVNVDEQPQLSGMFSISSIPTMIPFKNGQPGQKIIGAKPKAAIEADLATAFG